MNSILQIVWKLSVSGTILSLLLLLAMPLVKRHSSKAFCYYIWLPVMLRMMMPFGMEIQLPAGNSQSQMIVSPSQKVVGSPLTEAPLEGTASKPSAQIPQTAQDQPAQRSPRSFEYLRFIWLVGFFVSLGWYVISYLVFVLRLTRSFQMPGVTEHSVFYRMTSGGTVRLAVSPIVETPMLIGAIRPTIVLPEQAEWSEQELYYVLCHELTHWRRNDILYKWFFVIVALAVHNHVGPGMIHPVKTPDGQRIHPNLQQKVGINGAEVLANALLVPQSRIGKALSVDRDVAVGEIRRHVGIELETFFKLRIVRLQNAVESASISVSNSACLAANSSGGML